ncbi:DUF742 domain-containing protein [Streptomyces griseorubiginosus]|uniref:DUF742 domain-containing protein n=1 Tax=Streptomyces griseorubiginosus TaxID=67304 RepID=A0A101RPN1_9ACTN|nr:DUF742 domain-containing protein [Streptomyces griseorubiginosus]KUN59502.1 hypothetical protein AQJ54_39320 [Streptomyces griseorubiginosus]
MSKSRRDLDLVRAYVRTGGRSRPTRGLDLVTLVIAANADQQNLDPDQRRVMGLCRRQGALSVAEIAAHLDLPATVIKIIVSGLMDTGRLTMPTGDDANQPDIAVLKEVLHGLRKLA